MEYKGKIKIDQLDTLICKTIVQVRARLCYSLSREGKATDQGFRAGPPAHVFMDIGVPAGCPQSANAEKDTESDQKSGESIKGKKKSQYTLWY